MVVLSVEEVLVESMGVHAARVTSTCGMGDEKTRTTTRTRQDMAEKAFGRARSSSIGVDVKWRKSKEEMGPGRHDGRAGAGTLACEDTLGSPGADAGGDSARTGRMARSTVIRAKCCGVRAGARGSW